MSGGQMGRYEWGAVVTVIATYRDLYGADNEQFTELLDAMTLTMGYVFARNNPNFDGTTFFRSCGVGKQIGGSAAN